MPTINVINHTNNMKRRKSKIEYIIIHYSASTKSSKGSAEGTVRTLDKRGFSSDYAVDDNVIIQFADDPAAWRSTACQNWSTKGTAAGRYAKNDNSVSIEVSSSLEGGSKSDWVPNNPKFKFTDATLANTAYLCKMLISKYNIQKDHIIRHFDIMGKCCPGIQGWNTGAGSSNDAKFRAFVDSLYSGTPYVDSDITYNEVNYETVQPVTTAASNTGIASNVRSGPSNVVVQLSSAGKVKENVLKQEGDRKDAFLALVNKMTKETPNMGREILVTSELYDSNILKGDQESRKERTS